MRIRYTTSCLKNNRKADIKYLLKVLRKWRNGEAQDPDAEEKGNEEAI